MIEPLLDKINAIPADKVMHFTSGVVLFAVALPFITSTYAMALVLCIAFSKELYDALYADKHTSDFFDALATILGGGVGYFCAWIG